MRIESYLTGVAERAIEQSLSVEAAALLRPTTDPKHGDFQINAAMALGKQLGRPPRELAAAIAEVLGSDEAVAEATVAGPGFVNLRLSDAWIGERLSEAIADRVRDGVDGASRPENVVVDFSSPNIAKQMHVGHLRSTIIGDAIVRVLRFLGHRVIGDNHLGDWGTQFGLLIVGMREWGSEAALEDRPIDELERVYKLASARAKEDGAMAGAARAELAKLQAGDPDNRALWQLFVSATRVTLDAIYDRLGVRFDEWLGESAYHDMLPGVAQLLIDKGIAREDAGALCIFFKELEAAPDELKRQQQPFIVRKKDGAFLYSTTDIATLLHRRDVFHADRVIYVVGSPQVLHFKQLFAVAQMLGIEMRLEHVGFGAILGEDGKVLRTRSGEAVQLAGLLDEAERRAAARIEEGRAEGRLRIADADLAEATQVIGIGAVKYADLMQNRLSDYQFDWDKMLSFKGNAGPYMQYQYARARSIFDKGGADLESFEAPITLGSPEEAALGRILLRFADVVHKAADTCQPHLVCDHLYDLARGFSSFYTECPILAADEPLRSSRLALTALSGRHLRRGLGLLGIEVIERM